MIRRRNLAALLLSILLPASLCAAAPVNIYYEATPLGGNEWQCVYDVANNSLATPIEEFTIWFALGQYAQLALETPDPPATAWDELVVEPDPLLHADGFYDALTLATGIPAGEHQSGFTVRFEWLGTGEPGGQPFEIIDPVTFGTIWAGTTVPEPSTAGLLLIALAWASKR
ncbi:MAG TPA: PEP-CTERM sorting domain-containing protein [Phycisphaerae bacterium]|nr:PEP-CTERM sorting domain-containing protein [Phycisphaerae bacterium]HNU45503.1 PEP-CTERM sorting domain-containing protein [Phycisphaerae bacterium]